MAQVTRREDKPSGLHKLHPAGPVKPGDPNARIKCCVAEALRDVCGLVFDGRGSCFSIELGRREHVTEEMRENKPLFRLVPKRSASEATA